MIAPVIPGLNDSEIPQILKAAREAAPARPATCCLRLSGSVRPVFLEWLSRSEPTRAARVEGGHSPDARRPTQRHAIRTTHARHRNSRRADRPNVRDLRQAIRPRRAALVLRFLAISTAPNSGRTTATLLRIACERRGARSEDACKKTSRGDLEIPPIVVIRRQKQAVNKRVDSLPDSNTRSKHQAE